MTDEAKKYQMCVEKLTRIEQSQGKSVDEAHQLAAKHCDDPKILARIK